MTSKNIVFSSVMMIVVLTAAWMTLSYHPKPLMNKSTTLEPDAYMENVVTITLNQQGNPKMKLVTPQLIHFDKSDVTQLISPTLTLYRNSPQPWRVTAQYARAIKGIEQIDFLGNVVIKHAMPSHSQETVIKTASLRVFPNNQTAETQDAITLEQPNTLIKATGMLANMNSGDIKLISEARGEYVPSS